MTRTGSTTSPAGHTLERRAGAFRRCGSHAAAGTNNPTSGCLLPCAVDSVIVGWKGVPRLFAGRGPQGQRWLVVQIAESPDARRWLCAPASDRAISCVLSGRAQPVDLFRHSATGSVEDVTITSDGKVFESTRLCGELSENEVDGGGEMASWYRPVLSFWQQP